MGKKRKCRMDREELYIHDEAVRLRKMTDRQLVGAFRMATEDHRVGAKTMEKPKEAPKSPEAKKDTTGLEKVIQGISEGKVKGIGRVTSYKIAEYAREIGVLE